MLIEKIKKDRMQAMRNKDVIAKKVLTTVYGELQTIQKDEGGEITDEQVVSKCKKIVDANCEILEKDISKEQREKLTEENNVLESYLPTQLTKEEIRAIINNVKDKSIQSIMPIFSKEYKGRFDGKLVKEILKEF